MGEPKAGLVNAIVVGAVNLVLDPVLMFGCGLGVAGAAMATATAQWVRNLNLKKCQRFHPHSLGLDTLMYVEHNSVSNLSLLGAPLHQLLIWRFRDRPALVLSRLNPTCSTARVLLGVGA